MKWYQITDKPLKIYGLAVTEKEKYFRLPESIIDSINSGTGDLARMSAGGRVRFRTNSESFTVHMIVSDIQQASANMSVLSKSGFSVYVDGVFAGNRPGVLCTSCLFEKTFDKKPEMQDIDIYLPMFNRLLSMEIGVSDGAQVEAPRPYTYEKPIVFYGSSITHGAAAAHPGITYVARTARNLDANFINLGFSGNARGETAMAEYIAGLEMTAFVLDYDHNAPSAEHLKNTHKPFFDIIRAAQPDLPILMITKPDFHTYLGAGDNPERRDIVRATYEQALADGDRHVAFLDGESFFPEDEWMNCTADVCHPNDLGFYYMQKKATAALRELLAR